MRYMPLRIMLLYALAGIAAFWLLFLRTLIIAHVDADLDKVVSVISICISSAVIAIEYRRMRYRLRLVLFLFMLLLGFFVLILTPGQSGNDTVEWVASFILFISRALPLMGLVTLVAIAGRFPLWRNFFKPFEWWFRKPASIQILMVSCAVLGITASMAYFGYRCLPRVDDGVVNVFQARIFASGSLSLPPPPDSMAFRQFGMIQEPRWIGQFPPGTPALFALGLYAGVICFINPILSSLTVLPLFRIARRLFDSKTASLSILIFMASPFIPIVGGSFRNHALTLFLLAWSTALFLQNPRTSTSMVLSGFFCGLAFLARPYTVFLWCGGFMAALLITDHRSFLKHLPGFSIGAVPGIILTVLYTLEQTGGRLVSPPVYLHGELFDIGFGARMMGDHTFLRAVSYTMTRIEALSRMILGWPVPVIVLPLALVVAGIRDLVKRSDLFIMLLPPIALVVGYALFWCLEFTHGPRFLYSILILLIPLIARSMFVMPEFIHSTLVCDKDIVRSILGAACVFSIVFSAVGPWREAVQVFGSSYGCEIDLPDKIRELPDGGKLIFYTIRSVDGPGYGWGFLMNNLDLSGDVVVAIDGGQERNRKIANLFPERRIYRYEFDAASKKGLIEPLEIIFSPPDA